MITNSTPESQSCYLVLRRAAFVVLMTAVFLTGCVGRREALSAANALRKVSAEAVPVIENLKLTGQKEIEAHSQTRALAHDLHDNLIIRVRAEADANINLALQEQLLRVRAAELDALDGFVRHLERLSDETTVAIATRTKPLQDKIAELLDARNKAKAESDKFPGDLTLANTFLRQQQAYITAVDQKVEIERFALREVFTGAATILTNYTAKLRDSATKEEKNLSDLAAASRTSVAKQIQTKLDDGFDVGKEPEFKPEAYEALLAYANNVRDSANQFTGYLQLNSFGQNSALSIFLGNAGQGFMQGLPFIGEGKATTWSEAKTDFKSFIEDVGAEAKDALNAAGNTSVEALKTVKENALSAVRDKTNGMIDKLVSK